MNIVERVIHSWKEFDSFLASNSKSSNTYKYCYFLRNLYSATIEIEESSQKNLFPKLAVPYIKSLFLLLLGRPYLTNESDLILLHISAADEFLSKKLSVPLTKISYSFRPYPLNAISIFFQWTYISLRLLKSRELSRKIVIQIIPQLLLAILVDKRLKTPQIKLLITQRDRYPTEQVLIYHLRKNNIKSLKFDSFANLNPYNQNTIYCDFHFSPNKMNRKNFAQYPQNKSVTFLDGGFPFLDSLSEISYRPQEDSRIITFATQYGYESGYLGSYPPSFYIQEILNLIPANYQLYIKVHPLDDASQYEHFKKNPSVKVITHNSIDNRIIFSHSWMIFSIASQFSTDAKHICPRSFYLNYTPELVKDFQYNQISNLIDLVVTPEELSAILNNKKDAISQSHFQANFNPHYPHTCRHLQTTIHNLIKQHDEASRLST